MYGPVLSVLLMGLLPVMSAPGLNQDTAGSLAIASPSPFSVSSLQSAGIGDSLTASGLVLLDLQSGQQLYARNASVRRPIGSLTKLMTALLIVENHSLDEDVLVPSDIGKVEGTVASLSPGSHLTVGDLLSAMLMASDNDAAVTLAEFDAGSEKAFVQKMNDRAEVLGLQDTVFDNPAGLDGSGRSSALDIAWLASYAFAKPAIRQRMSLPETVIKDTDGRTYSIVHTHTLLHEDPRVIAGKTGTTPAAKQCLLTILKEGDREYLAVILGSRERYTDMRSLLKTLSAFFV